MPGGSDELKLRLKRQLANALRNRETRWELLLDVANQIEAAKAAENDADMAYVVENIMAGNKTALPEMKRALGIVDTTNSLRPEDQDQPVEPRFEPQAQSFDQDDNQPESPENGEEPVGDAPKEGTQAKPKNRLQDIQDRIQKQRQELMRKLAYDAVKKWAATQIMAIAAYLGAPFWAVVAGLLLLSAILIFAIFFAVSYYRNSIPGPKPGGGGTAILANPAADADWINTFLQASGDDQIRKDLIAGDTEKLQKAMTAIQTELDKPENATLPERGEILVILEAIRSELNKITTQTTESARKNNEQAAQRIFDVHIKKLRTFTVGATLTPFDGSKSLPLPIQPTGFGIGLHDWTLNFNKDEVREQNGNRELHHGTFQFYKQDKGDAGDFFVPKGTELLAVMDGKLSKYLYSPECSPFCLAYYLDGKDNKGRNFRVTYGHMIANTELEKKINEEGSVLVNTNNSIGRTGAGDLHFEITIDGKPVNFSKADIEGPRCQNLKYYDTGVAAAGISKRCNVEATNLSEIFWEYTKLIFKP